MPRITWGSTGARRYEAGVDRGVLYLSDGKGVAWNGLTAVEEVLDSVTSESYYYDGVKYMDTREPGDFEATLKAFTFPDEFLQYDGFAELGNSVLLGHQPVYDRFGLSYRTRIGDDVQGVEAGYKIHVLYNLIATPSNRSYTTGSDKLENTDFEWHISGVPEPIEGHRPTVHIILDTTKMNPYLIRDVEDLLYGTGAPPTAVDTTRYDGGTAALASGEQIDGGTAASTGFGVIDAGTAYSSAANAGGAVSSIDPHLPPLSELVALLNSWVLVDIVDNGDGTWTASGPSEFVEMTSSTSFRISSSTAKMLDPNTYEISASSTL